MSADAATPRRTAARKTVVEVVPAYGIRPDPVTGFDRFGVKGHRAHCMACGFLSEIFTPAADPDGDRAAFVAKEHRATHEEAA